MSPATEPRPAHHRRLLVVGSIGSTTIAPALALPALLSPFDLVVVNDASTLPGRFPARDVAGRCFEIRVSSVLDETPGSVKVMAVLLGEGDPQVRTEDRTPPPPVAVGDRFRIADMLVARVLAISPISERLLTLEFTLRKNEAPRAEPGPGDVWSAIFREGKPVQYAHVRRPLALWDVQSAWATRPWAVEVPSAGLFLSAETILSLRARGIEVVSVTHAAGLSATGDERIDARLPLAERFEVTEETAAAVRRAQARGGRVVAIGTSVVRALESAARVSSGYQFEAARGFTEFLVEPGSALQVVDGILTGVHEIGSSHLRLLQAFASADVLETAREVSEREGFLGHEFGDAWLVWSSRSPMNPLPSGGLGVFGSSLPASRIADRSRSARRAVRP